MLDMLLKQMLPQGFDLEKTISQVTDAIKLTVVTVQRVEQTQNLILSRLDAIQARQDATLPHPMTQGNDDYEQHSGTPGNPASAAPGCAAGSGDNPDCPS